MPPSSDQVHSCPSPSLPFLSVRFTSRPFRRSCFARLRIVSEPSRNAPQPRASAPLPSPYDRGAPHGTLLLPKRDAWHVAGAHAPHARDAPPTDGRQPGDVSWLRDGAAPRVRDAPPPDDDALLLVGTCALSG